MTVRETDEYKKLEEALSVINELKVPENLQKTALEFFLNHNMVAENANLALPAPQKVIGAVTPLHSPTPLRDFIEEMKPKGAVAEIPCLLYWAKTNDQKEALDEKGIIELYRMSGLKPPKNVTQSLRDLCSKKYGRLESVADQKGFVKLSRVGEDFVLHDVKKSA